MAEPVKTTCPYCGVGCGVLATRHDDGRVSVAGDPDHPANFGRLCSKGAALGDTVGLDGRLLHPVVDGRRASWDRAVDRVARRFRETLAEHGPGSVAFYVSGQLLTEDYYVANKLMKGFLGSANIDTNSRLCMSSSVAGHVRAFGSDTVPGCYEDLEQADLVVLAGSNLAWCHPVLFQRLVRARKRRGTRVVVVDPRRTDTCAAADLHLAVKPGTDVVLFNGLLAHLDRQGAGAADFLDRHAEGAAEALEAARRSAPDAAAVAAACDLPVADVRRFFDAFAETERTVTVYSQGINQSVQGTDKVNAILNCHLFTGRLGRPGMGPFSVTGQPNAMGGREVGGLANMLAAHMNFAPAEVDLVRAFWDAPAMAGGPGLKAVDLFDAVGAGTVKALWVMCTNPAASLPDGDRVRAALEACDFLVVSDCVADTDTARHAHVLLPAATWGERDGTVTNSERCISRQRPFLPAPGEARPDWRIVCDVARAMGFGAAFAYDSPAAIFDEHARLSARGNNGTRDFDIGGLAGLDRPAYDALAPVRWPVPEGTSDGTPRLFAGGGFFRPGGRARLVPVAPRPPRRRPGGDRPFTLNTGRVRDQWHTMTRSGRAPALARHRPEPYVDIHPADAAALAIGDGDLARVTTPYGDGLFRVAVTEGQRPGELFVPMHWSDATSARSACGRLTAPETDPVSGQPGSKLTPAAIAPWAADWHGFLLSRRALVPEGADYWSTAAVPSGRLTELAGQGDPLAAFRRLLDQCGAPHDLGDWITYQDARRGGARAALVVDGRLEACLFIGRQRVRADHAWLSGLLAADALSDDDRQAVLAGRAGAAAPDAGPIVCACFAVGLRTIVSAIRDHGLVDVEAIGQALQAGTNCGSCLPELADILATTQAAANGDGGAISDAA